MSKKRVLGIWSSVTVVLLILAYAASQLLWQGVAAMVSTSCFWGEEYVTEFARTIYLQNDGGVNLTDLHYCLRFNDQSMNGGNEKEDNNIVEELLSSTNTAESYILLCDDMPRPAIASGSWIFVYRHEGGIIPDNSVDYLDYSFALMNAEEAYDREFGKELYRFIYEDHDPNRAVSIDRYALKELELIPLHITTYKENEVVKEYTPYTDSEIPEEFRIYEDDDVWIYISGGCIPPFIAWSYEDKELLQRAKAVAERAADSIDYRNTQNGENASLETGTDWFVANIVRTATYKNADGHSYSLVYSIVYDAFPTFVLFAVLLEGIWLVIFAIIVFAFRKRKNKKIEQAA